MDLHSEQLHTCTPDSYRLFLRRKRLVTLALLAVLAALALLSLTRLCVALDCVEEIRNLFTQVEYGSIEEVLRERT